MSSKWTPEALTFLQQNYGKMPNAELGAALGKTKASVSAAAWRMGLKFPEEKKPIKKRKFPQGLRDYLMGEML